MSNYDLATNVSNPVTSLQTVNSGHADCSAQPINTILETMAKLFDLAEPGYLYCLANPTNDYSCPKNL